MQNSPFRIALVSASVLILELTLIRILPAENHAVSYFTNLLLMSSFFGLGLGCILAKKHHLGILFPIGLLSISVFLILTKGMAVYETAGSIYFWLDPPEGGGSEIRLPIFVNILWAFLSSALPFIPLGQRLVMEMDKHPRLSAYGYDIGGSIAGTLIFSIISGLAIPPWIWPPILSLIYAAIFLPSVIERLTLILAGALVAFSTTTSFEARWSPYYLIQSYDRALGLSVWVNGRFHQQALSFGSQDPTVKVQLAELQGKFSVPYEIYRQHHQGRSPDSVLILGAGTGNDVNIARLNGAKKITAVEIDPTILSLGKAQNPIGAYSDPRVTAIVDDARHYLASSKEQFDLIVFGTLDSQTLLSGVANVRLENYVYTAEALEDAKKLLKPNGMVALYYSVYAPWLYGRIYSTVEKVFGDNMQILFAKDRFLFNTVILASRDLSALKDAPENKAQFSGGLPSTDNWPFLYLEKPTIAPIYRWFFAVLLSLVALAYFILRKVEPKTGLHLNFLLLGVGFTLVQSAAIVRLALLFGSTWVVSSVVFTGVLITILVGNWLTERGSMPRPHVAWLLVILGLIGNGLFPVGILAGLSWTLRIVLSILLIGVPVLGASFCFSHLFQKQKSTGYALGLNLIGAMAGGIVEYLSMILGVAPIWFIAAGIYGLAWYFSRACIRSIHST